MGSRRVVVLALPGSFSLDVLGTFEIFVSAARLLAARELGGIVDPTHAPSFRDMSLAYQVELVGEHAGSVQTSGGTLLHASRALAEVCEPLDTFIIAGGDVRLLLEAARNPELIAQIRRVAQLSRRVASVCTGSFVLAAAGLLDGKRATTHWAACDALQKLFPRVQVEHDPIYTQDGNVYTSAGASTGVDLTLSLVRDDYGHQLAQEVARWLVLYVHRPAGQAQLSVPLRTQEADRAPLRELQRYIIEHPHEDLSVEALAARVGMSVRNFARAFRREVAQTPAAYVQAVRVEAARRKLSLSRASIEEVAQEVGFGSVETLRRAFSRELGMSPADYRARLASHSHAPTAHDSRRDASH